VINKLVAMATFSQLSLISDNTVTRYNTGQTATYSFLTLQYVFTARELTSEWRRARPTCAPTEVLSDSCAEWAYWGMPNVSKNVPFEC